MLLVAEAEDLVPGEHRTVSLMGLGRLVLRASAGGSLSFLASPFLLPVAARSAAALARAVAGAALSLAEATCATARPLSAPRWWSARCGPLPRPSSASAARTRHGGALQRGPGRRRGLRRRPRTRPRRRAAWSSSAAAAPTSDRWTHGR